MSNKGPHLDVLNVVDDVENPRNKSIETRVSSTISLDLRRSTKNTKYGRRGNFGSLPKLLLWIVSYASENR